MVWVGDCSSAQSLVWRLLSQTSIPDRLAAWNPPLVLQPCSPLAVAAARWDGTGRKGSGLRLCLLWVVGMKTNSNGINRTCVPPPQVDQSCSLELISTCICMCQLEPPPAPLFLPPNSIRAVFHAALHVQTSDGRLAVLSLSVTVEPPQQRCRALSLIGLKGETNDYWRRANRATYSKQIFFYYRQHSERGLTHRWLTAAIMECFFHNFPVGENLLNIT